jgi:hypothetical protein
VRASHGYIATRARFRGWRGNVGAIHAPLHASGGLTCFDVSSKSFEIGRARFGGKRNLLYLTGFASRSPNGSHPRAVVNPLCSGKIFDQFISGGRL